MAKAIKQIDRSIPTAEEKQAAEVNELISSITEHKETLLLLLEIIEEFHKVGLLDMLQGVLKTRHKLGLLAMEELDKPVVHDLVKSGIGAFNFLTKVDPEQFSRILNGMSEGLKHSSEQLENDKTLGIWGMMKATKDPEVNRSLTTFIHFLEGMGKGLKTK
ncbi:DUF1641 domain-containing protein [Halobacillus sp. B23F22_1]|uniref:DUF1641 domain-containing protein n=1 Tax=Halobacillus sp. B23F22_1 TaxID=3459514 RepID=UPI00373E7853